MQEVIIVGGNHHNTLGVIRGLGRVGLHPIVILTSGNHSSFVLRSKYIKDSYLTNGSKEAIELLLNTFANSNAKSVLIACHDEIASELDQNRSRLESFFIIPGVNKQGALTPIMNKKIMGDIAEEIGIEVPKMIISNNETIESLKEYIYFPCITKPVESKCGSKTDICTFSNFGGLDEFLNQNLNRDFIIQQFVERDFEYQLIGCSLDEGNEIIIPGVSKILRPAQSSNTSFLCYSELDNSYEGAIHKCKEYIRKVGYSGLFSMEFIRGKDGKDYFLEINYRNDGNAISVTNAGVNLPYIWYLYCLKKDYKTEIKKIHEEYVMPEFAEMSMYVHGCLTWKEWNQDMALATSYMDYAADDTAPTKGWWLYRIHRILSPLKRLAIKVLR